MKLTLAILLACLAANAETGRVAWLRYAKLDHSVSVPDTVTALSTNILEQSARDEVVRGVKGMLGKDLKADAAAPKDGAILLGTLAPDAFWLKNAILGKAHYLVIAGGYERGVLYGSFALMRKIALGDDLKTLEEKQTPRATARWVNEWDNLAGAIERGYGGRSIFWDP